MKRKNRPVFNPYLAQYLLLAGFEIKDTKPNLNDLRRTVYYFEDSQAVNEAIEQYEEKKHNEREVLNHSTSAK